MGGSRAVTPPLSVWNVLHLPGRLAGRTHADMTSRLLSLWWLAAVSVCLAACGDDTGAAPDDDDDDDEPKCSVSISPSDDDQSELQGALIDAESGDTVCLEKGRFKLTRQLTLSAERVTVRGEEGTILDFSEQTAGANGFEISADHVTLESVRIENPKGDGVRATEVDSPTIRNVQVVWTGGPSTGNGGYGIYPVLSKNVLVEDCFASGASDTGIYVGQSEDIVIRNNEVTENVAGIEIENSTDAEVYGNHAHGNTGGILVFNLPGLMVKDGKRARVYDNQIEDNNLANFAQAGNIVADLPAGSGVFILASDDNEVYDNVIKNHDSAGITLVSWYVTLRDEEGMKDADYDWFPERNSFHDNEITESGDMPQGRAVLIASVVGETTLADIVWDGIVDTSKLEEGEELGTGAPSLAPESLRNCFRNNEGASFINLDLEHDGEDKTTDIEPYACSR